MELPRYKSTALPQEATLSPQQAAAGSGAMGQAFAGIAADFAKVTARIGEAEAIARANLEYSRQRLAIDEFRSDPRWQKPFQEVNGERVSTADVYEAEYSSLQKSLLSSTPKLNSRSARQQFTLKQNELLEGARFEVQAQSNKLRIESSRAIFQETLINLRQAGQYDEAQELIVSMAESGVISEPEAARFRTDTEQDKYLKKLNALGDLSDLREISQRPPYDKTRIEVEDQRIEELLARGDEALNDTRLTPEQQRVMQNYFHGRANSIANQRARELAEWEREQRRLEQEASQAARLLAKDIGDRIGVLETRLGNGIAALDDLAELALLIGSLPDDEQNKRTLAQRLNAISRLTNMGDGGGSFYLATPEQQLDLITSLENAIGDERSDQTELDDILSLAYKVHRETERRFKDDPVGFEMLRGNLPQPEADPNDIEAVLAEAIDRRPKVSAMHGENRSGLTTPQSNRFMQAIDSGDMAAKVEAVTLLVEAGGPEFARAALREMGGKGNDAMILGGVLLTEDRRAGVAVWTGLQQLQNNPALLRKGEVNPAIADRLGDAYGFGSERRDAVTRGIQGAYVALMTERGKNPEIDFDSRIVDEAVGLVTGGLVDHNGHMIPAPQRGVTQRDFTRWHRSIGRKDFESVSGATPDEVYKQFLGGELTLEESGEPGAYMLIRDRLAFDPVMRYIRGADGNPFLLRYSDVPRVNLLSDPDASDEQIESAYRMIGGAGQ